MDMTVHTTLMIVTTAMTHGTGTETETEIEIGTEITATAHIARLIPQPTVGAHVPGLARLDVVRHHAMHPEDHGLTIRHHRIGHDLDLWTEPRAEEEEEEEAEEETREALEAIMTGTRLALGARAEIGSGTGVRQVGM